LKEWFSRLEATGIEGGDGLGQGQAWARAYYFSDFRTSLSLKPFEKDLEPPILAEISATYILYQQEDVLRIVFQLDHKDLMKWVQDLGLLPIKD
jgi:hypothetical protein